MFLFDTFKDEVFDVVDELDEEGLIEFRTLRLNTLFFWFPGFFKVIILLGKPSIHYIH